MNTLKAARKEAEYLLKDPNVVGVGIGLKCVRAPERKQDRGIPCITVSVVKKGTYHIKDRIPVMIMGCPTDVVETGLLVALQDRTDRWRPAPGGVSIGHKLITAGTLACLVTRGGEWFVLSNNHVLANMNNAEIGDEILQPGKADGGTVAADVIATLWEFVPVKFLFDNLPDCPTATGVAKMVNLLARLVGSKHRVRAFQDDPLATNLVDAAIAKPIYPDNVIRDVLGIQTPTGHREVKLGDPVVKSGRTTGVTRGTVTQVDATLQIVYGNNIAVFEQQVVTDAECGGGDSGSIVLADDESGDAVGLLFAGTQDGKTMIMCQIGHVLDLLGVEIAG